MRSAAAAEPYNSVVTSAIQKRRSLLPVLSNQISVMKIWAKAAMMEVEYVGKEVAYASSGLSTFTLV
jgi:hypothetical protein